MPSENSELSRPQLVPRFNARALKKVIMANHEHRETPPPDGRFHASRGILLTQGLRLAVRVVTAAGLARLVSPADYGIFGMAAFVHGLAYVIQDFGLASVTLRKASLPDDERTALFWLNAAAGATLALVVAALGPLAAVFFGEPLLAKLLPILAVTLALNGLHAQLRVQLGREHRFAELNRIEIVAFIVSSGAALLAGWLGGGSWALATLPLSAELLIAVGVWRAQAWRPGVWPRGFSPRASLAFGAGISGHEILRYLQRNADQFFVGRWFGSGALGLYGRGVQLVVLPGQYLSDPLATWVIASLGRAHDAPAAARAFWCRVVNGLAHLTLPMAVVLFSVPGEILRIAFGPAWVGGAGILRGLSVGLVAQPILAALTWLLIATGHGRRLLWWSGATLVTVVVACAITLHLNPTALSYAASGALLGATVGGAIFAMGGLPAGPRDLLGAVARPAVATVFAVVMTNAALSLAAASGASLRLGIGGAVVAVSWAMGCAAPGFREELKSHFLRRQP